MMRLNYCCVYFLHFTFSMLLQDYRNLESYICNAYKGTTKPSACSESSLRRSIQKVKMGPMASLYTEVTSKSKMSQIGRYILTWLDQEIEWQLHRQLYQAQLYSLVAVFGLNMIKWSKGQLLSSVVLKIVYHVMFCYVCTYIYIRIHTCVYVFDI